MDDNDIEIIIDKLAKLFEGKFWIETVIALNQAKGRQHYLAPSKPCELCGIDRMVSNNLTRICGSMEVFIKTPAKEISTKLANLSKLKISATVIKTYQKELSTKYSFLLTSST